MCRPLRTLLFIPVITIALAFGATGAHAQTAGTNAPSSDNWVEKTSAIAGPSVVRLQIEWKAWVDTGEDLGRVGPIQMSFGCTGFIVDPSGYIVTAGHCVDTSFEGIGSDVLGQLVKAMVSEGLLTEAEASSSGFLEYAIGAWRVEGPSAGSKPEPSVTVVHGIARSAKGEGEAAPARVIEANSVSKGDVALLKVEATDLPIVQLADDANLTVGTSVLSIGYPGSSDQVVDPTLTPTFKDGRINSKTTREGGLIPVYEVSAAMSPGMSGGPTVSPDGKVVGLNSFKAGGESQPFNFISPASLIKETLARNSVKAQLGPSDVAYRAGLDAYFSGDYRTAVTKFDEVLARVPYHSQAQQYKQLAQQKVASMPSTTAASDAGSGSALPFVIGGVLLLLGIAGLGTALVIVRRRPGTESRGLAGEPGHARSAPAPAAPSPASPASAPPRTGMPATAPPPSPIPTVSGNGSASSGQPVLPTTAPEPSVPSAPAGESRVAGTTVTVEPEVFCSQCGHESRPEERFCPACGHDLHHV